MRVYILIIAVVAAVVVKAARDASTTSAKKRVDTIMNAVDDHCRARRKRYVSPRSDDKVRRIIYQAMAECLEGGGGPPPSPEPTYYPPPAGACSDPATVNLTGDWRLDNKGSDIQPIDGNYNCDAPLFDNVQWFRITGDGGNRIRDSCSPPYSCGSHGGIWTNATMPANVGDIVQTKLYGSWAGNCDWYPWQVDYPLTVQRCGPGANFVYKIDGLTGCHHSVCGMWG